MNLSALVLVLSIAALLKLTLGLVLTMSWKRRRARRYSKTSAGESRKSSARRPVLLPRLDTGHQSVSMLDAGRGHSIELVYHTDPGRQQMHRRDRLAHGGAVL